VGGEVLVGPIHQTEIRARIILKLKDRAVGKLTEANE